MLAATQASLSSHSRGSASGKFAFSPPPVFSVPFAPSTAFISTLQAVPFQSIISSPPTLVLREVGERESMLRGVEFFLSFLAPMAIRHKALCPFLRAFSPPSTLSFLSFLLLPSYEKPLECSEKKCITYLNTSCFCFVCFFNFSVLMWVSPVECLF